MTLIIINCSVWQYIILYKFEQFKSYTRANTKKINDYDIVRPHFTCINSKRFPILPVFYRIFRIVFHDGCVRFYSWTFVYQRSRTKWRTSATGSYCTSTVVPAAIQYGDQVLGHWYNTIKIHDCLIEILK